MPDELRELGLVDFLCAGEFDFDGIGRLSMPSGGDYAAALPCLLI